MEKSEQIYISVAKGLIETKHFEAMGISVWLYLWFIDHMTTLSGSVLGGKPIKYEEVAKDIKISERAYNRWVDALVAAKYIETVRAPYGLIVTVTKAKKLFHKRLNSPAKNGGTEYQRSVRSGGTDTPQVADLYTKSGGSNKDKTVDKTVRQDNTPPTPSKGEDMKKKKAAEVEQLDREAAHYLRVWRKVRHTKHTDHSVLVFGLKHYRKQYPLNDILEAILASKWHNFYRQVRDPVILLRTRNSAGPANPIEQVLENPEWRKVRARELHRWATGYYNPKAAPPEPAINQEQAAANLKRLEEMKKNLFAGFGEAVRKK